MKNCLIKPTFGLGTTAPVYYGIYLQGTATIEGCTFDLNGITGNTAAYFTQGFIDRVAALNLTFANNVYLVPAGESLPVLYGATQSDLLNFSHNAYNLGGGTVFARNTDATGSLTFSQWQYLGEDCINSSLNANLQLNNDVPQSSSPLSNAGLDLGRAPISPARCIRIATRLAPMKAAPLISPRRPLAACPRSPPNTLAPLTPCPRPPRRVSRFPTASSPARPPLTEKS